MVQHGRKARRRDKPDWGDRVCHSGGDGRRQAVPSPGYSPQGHRSEGLRSLVRERQTGGKGVEFGKEGLQGQCDRDRRHVVRHPAGRHDQWGVRTSDEGLPLPRVPSAALACISPADIERLMAETNPANATTVVCAAVAFLLAPDDNAPEDFCWPQGFEAIARPAEMFLKRLQNNSSRVANPFKARVLRFVLQREDILPVVVEQQVGRTAARQVTIHLEGFPSRIAHQNAATHAAVHKRPVSKHITSRTRDPHTVHGAECLPSLSDTNQARRGIFHSCLKITTTAVPMPLYPPTRHARSSSSGQPVRVGT